MIDEYQSLNDNKNTVNDNDTPYDTPMYFFISSEQNEQVPGWQDALETFIDSLTNGNRMLLERGHYLHHEDPLVLVNEINTFITSLND
jgi:hypothetical protein